MKRLVFLVEERSIAEVLETLLPRLLPEEIAYQVVPHEGKSDLERSIPHKLRGWKEPEVRFVIVRDNDRADCKALKARLQQVCSANGRPDTVIRLVCQELEAWYLGDLNAVAQAYGRLGLGRSQERNPYRNPDQISSPSQLLQKLIPEHSQIAGAKAIAPYMSLEQNRSHSFHVFVQGVRHLLYGRANLEGQTEIVFPEASSRTPPCCDPF